MTRPGRAGRYTAPAPDEDLEMDWSAPTWWWVAGGLLVAAELASGTFYLLMLATGCVAAALAAHAGGALAPQLLAAAVVGGGATAAWHVVRGRRAQARAAVPASLDVGEHVQVEAWAADASARVHYRGSLWDARWAGPGAPQPGPHRIRAVDGNRLVLERTG